ncbi:MAG: FHA domain-containing protein [Steroidobacteraceae bacterium]|jgi:hypothetical protein|nr:FHA domain-containing protein [Steroidobacteraceae bacterium]
MSLVALELVDAGLVALKGEALSAPSPGVALLDPAGVTVGREAAAALRLKPVLAADRFWSALSLEPLARTAPGVRCTADLAWLHLSRLWAEISAPGDEALVAVPGSLRGESLGLAAGIARAAGVPVAGWVDAAVAACAALPAEATVLHLDVELHQSVLTVMGGGNALRRQRVDIAPRVGLKALQAAWAQVIAETMVRRTRFDPLHQAAAEQQLFDRLPRWLAAAAAGATVDIQVESGAGSFGVSLPGEQFAFVAEAWYSQLVDLLRAAREAEEPATLALSSRAARLPGLAARCAELPGLDVVELPEGAAARGALDNAASLGGGPPALVTALPRAHPLAPAGAAAHGEPPTHVLFAGRAHPITAEPLVVGLDPGAPRSLTLPGPAPGVSPRHCELLCENGSVIVRDLSGGGTFLNGERVTGQARVAAGDRLRLGRPGLSLDLVAVG